MKYRINELYKAAVLNMPHHNHHFRWRVSGIYRAVNLNADVIKS
jgi:hypothetical protein